MKATLKKLGFFMLCFGAMCADSENLIVPAVIVIVGSLMIMCGVKEA